jgi:polysaccharide pyruvyl transferase WcaK-like protein
MKKIFIVGYFGFDNFGDEWLLKTTIKLLYEQNRDIKFFVLYNIGKIAEAGKNVVYIPRWKPVVILKTLLQVDTVISVGGLFQDKTSVLSLVYYLLILFFAKVFNKKVVVLNSELDVTKLPKSFVYFFLQSLADYIFVRNKIDLRRNKKIMFCPDICISDFDEKNKSNPRSINKIGLVLKHTIKFEMINTMCKTLSKQYRLVFVPFHIKEDYPFCLKLCSSLNNCEIRVWDKIENYKNIFADIDLIITSRLHGVILSSVLNKLFLCISEEEKIKKLINSMFMLEPVSLDLWKQKGFQINEKNIFFPQSDIIKNYKNLVFKIINELDKNVYMEV